MTRKTSIALIAGIVLTLALLFVLFVWPSEAPKEEQPHVRLGYLPITADVSLFVAIDQGFFEREGVLVDPIRFTSSNQAMDPLIHGDTDGAVMIGYSTLLSIFARDPEVFRIVQSGVETLDTFTARVLVPPDSPLQKLDDLAGKSVGTYSGLTQRINLLLILSHFFESPETDVQIVQVASNLQVPAFAAGRFDALFTIDPHATVAIHKGLGRSISDSPRARFIVDPFPTCATVFSQSFLREHPDLARKTIAALNAATDWAVQNPQEAATIISDSKYTNVSSAIAAKCGTYHWWKRGEEQLDVVQRLADIMLDHGLLERTVNVVDMFADLRTAPADG